MKTFTDNAGRTWSLTLNIDALRRVRDQLSINLLDLTVGQPPLLTRLGTDLILLVDVIFCLCQEQATAQSVDSTGFGKAMGGTVIEAASRAFFEELADFFRGLARMDLVRAIEAQNQLIAAAIRQADATLSNLNIEQIVASTFGNLSGSSPESSVSTPGS